VLFLRRCKTEKLKGIFPQMSMNVKTDGVADFGESIKDIKRDKDLIAYASDIDNDLAGELMRQSSANLCNHCESGFL
jgi:hypothetical protein